MLEIKSIEYKKKANLVFERIMELVNSNQLKEGDTLPSQHEIAKKLCVGIQSVREGYSSLEMCGVIKIKGGKGTVIASDKVNFFAKPKMLSMLKSKEEILNCFDILKVLEKESYFLCTLNAGSKDLKLIEETLTKINKEFIKKRSYALSNDRIFHLAIAKSSKNKILVDLFEYLWSLSDKDIDFWQNLINGVYPGFEDFSKKDIDFNNKIFELIKNKDLKNIEKTCSEYHFALRNIFEKLF